MNVNLQGDTSLLELLDALDRDPTIEELGEISFFIKIRQPDSTEQSSGRPQFPRIVLCLDNANDRESVIEMLHSYFPNRLLVYE